MPSSHGQLEEYEFPDGLFTEISEKYVDEKVGLQIEFPDGWSGIGFAGMAVVVPGGIEEVDETSSIETSAIMIMALPRMEFSNAFSSLGALNEQVEANANDQNCRIQKYAYTKVNSIDGIQIVAECDSSEEYSNVNMYGVMSEKNFVLVAFAAKTDKDYNENISTFEKSIKTLQIDNPLPFKTAMSQTLKLKKVNQELSVKGAKFDLKVQTNSEVTNVAFSESEKRISLRVSGQDGTDGIVIIPIDQVLEGPYTVSVDGRTTTNFVIAEDSNTGQKSLEINYNHSVHDIVVSGTSVVPEFPPAALAALLGIIGMMAILTRTRILRNAFRV
jgi:hypothetical protein